MFPKLLHIHLLMLPHDHHCNVTVCKSDPVHPDMACTFLQFLLILHTMENKAVSPVSMHRIFPYCHPVALTVVSAALYYSCFLINSTIFFFWSETYLCIDLFTLFQYDKCRDIHDFVLHCEIRVLINIYIEKVYFSSYSSKTSSNTGANILHGPHHVAEKNQ